MKINKFKNITITKNILEYFDKLSEYASKDNYKLGESEEEIKNSGYIGRYKMDIKDIYNIDIDISLNYLLYTNEGHIRQDELILIYFNMYLFKSFSDFIIQNENKYIFSSEYKKSYRLTVSNLLAVIHIFSFSVIKNFIENKKEIFTEYKVSIYTILEDLEKYDLYDITNYKQQEEKNLVVTNETKNVELNKDNKKNSFEGFLKEIMKLAPNLIKLINPNNVNKEVNEIDKIKDKIQNNENIDISSVENKEVVNLLKSNEKDILSKLDTLKEQIISTNKELNKLKNQIENADKSIKIKSDKAYAILDDSKESLDKLCYTKDNNYVENSTGKKITKNKKEIDEIFYEYDKETKDNNGNGNIKKQKNFDNFRNKKEDNIDILDTILYILENKVSFKNSLESLESSLKNIGTNYMKKDFFSDSLEKISFNVINRGLAYIDKKIEENLKIKIPKLSNEYADKLSNISDIDDIIINIDDLKDDKYYNTKAYQILKKIEDDKLVEESFNYEKYTRSRRLLDNILIELIKALTKTKEDFDGVKDKNKNILRNTIIEMYKRNKGFNKKIYNEYLKLNDLNLTSFILHIIFNKTPFSFKNLNYISEYILKTRQLSFKEYLNNDKFYIHSRNIKKKFYNKNTLRAFCLENKIISIYTFYNDIFLENNQENRIKDSFVCEGASLSCSFGVGVSKLIVNNSKTYINGLKKASVEDKNITPFTACSVCNVCKPNIVSNWISTSNEYANDKSLLQSSKALCSFGGIISIINTNQNLQTVANISRKNDNTQKINRNITEKGSDSIRCKWIDYAYNEYLNYQGRKENSRTLARNGDIPLRDKIIKYHAISGIMGNYKLPWCMSFVNYIMTQSLGINLKTASTDKFSKIYKNGYIKIERAYYGAVAYFRQYSNNGKYLGKGHITFIIGESFDKKTLICLGGNQNNEIKISKYNKNKQYINKDQYIKLESIFWPKNITITEQYKLKEEDFIEIEGGIESV